MPTPGWLTVKTTPATVIVAVRAAPEFAAMANRTVPLPWPFAPEVTVSHASLPVAVHGQLEPASTSNEPVVPASGASAFDGVTAKPHTVWAVDENSEVPSGPV